MHSSEFLNIPFAELQKRGGDLREQYLHAQPFPFIVLDGLFQEQQLREVIGEFPYCFPRQTFNSKTPMRRSSLPAMNTGWEQYPPGWSIS